MEKMLHNVGELSTVARSAVESLLGHPLRDDQTLYIAALEVQPPLAAERRAAIAELRQMIEEMHENVRASGVPEDEVDRIVDRACTAVRYGD